jgi:hypothetical protein
VEVRPVVESSKMDLATRYLWMVSFAVSYTVVVIVSVSVEVVVDVSVKVVPGQSGSPDI